PRTSRTCTRILGTNEATAFRRLCRHSLNLAEAARGEDGCTRRQCLNLIRMRAQGVKTRRPAVEQPMGLASSRWTYAPGNSKSPSLRIAPHDPTQGDRRELHPPAASPHRPFRGQGSSGKVDRASNCWGIVISAEWRAGQDYAVESLNRHALWQRIAIGDVDGRAMEIRPVQTQRGFEQFCIGLDTEAPEL